MSKHQYSENKYVRQLELEAAQADYLEERDRKIAILRERHSARSEIIEKLAADLAVMREKGHPEDCKCGECLGLRVKARRKVAAIMRASM